MKAPDIVCLFVAFSVHGAVLAAAAAAALALLFVPDHTDDYRRNDTYQYQGNYYSSEICRQPCEHATTPLCIL